jgi:Cu+-exporting ATPase
MVGTGVAARHGILFKGGDSLEMAGKIKAILFDKTGTLTQGKPSVDPDSCLYLAPSNDSGVTMPVAWSLIGNLEGLSEHILGKAIATYARALASYQSLSVTEFESETGSGVKGIVDAHQVHIGDARYCQRNGIEVTDVVIKSMAIVQQRGQMAVLAAVDRTLVMMIAITDTLKQEARSVIDSLKAHSIHVYMVTGDHYNSAIAIGEQLGIEKDHIIAQVSPTDKAEVVSQLQRHYQDATPSSSKPYIAFCGDGINDSVAIAQADVGIAIGSGTEIAIEAASVVLMRPSLHGVLTAIDCSRVIIQRIRLNFLLAFIYNVLAIPIAAGALFPFTHLMMPPALAAMAMGLSSISVISSSLLLKRWSPPKFFDSCAVYNSTNDSGQKLSLDNSDYRSRTPESSDEGHIYIFDSADVETDGLISSDEETVRARDVI